MRHHRVTVQTIDTRVQDLRAAGWTITHVNANNNYWWIVATCTP